MALAEAFRACWLIAIFGCLLFIVGTGMLFWNEGRAVHKALSLDEALEDAITLEAGDMEDDEQNYNGRIVHILGPIVVGEPLTEPDYNIQVLAVKLKRRVQMYQWVEETVEHNFGGSVASFETADTKYYYYKEWRDHLVDSRLFYIQSGHKNPDKFPINSETQVADAVFIGKYELGTDVKQKFNNFVDLTSDTRPEDAGIKLHLGLYYHTLDVFNPQIGDLRIMFFFAGMEGELYTIVGKLENNKLVPFITRNGIEILLVYPGELTLKEVFKREHHAQRLATWGVRFIGWVLIFFGVTCTSRLLYIILSQVRILCVLAPDPQYPVGANLMLSLSLALTIASVAWVLHRPMIGAGLLVAAASPFVWCARSVASYQQVY